MSDDSITWKIDNLDKVDSTLATVLGSPAIIETELGRALQFDGAADALIVEDNPIAGRDAFTIEVIFRPDSGGNTEQRFLHFQEVDSHRVLIETRLTENGKWFLDTYMKYGNSDKTLYAKNHLHDLNQWYHMA
ncbi:MAG: LamG domain-containing protein, partial [Calditrichia bacterium]